METQHAASLLQQTLQDKKWRLSTQRLYCITKKVAAMDL